MADATKNPAKKTTVAELISRRGKQREWEKLIKSGCDPETLSRILEIILWALAHPQYDLPHFWVGLGRNFHARLGDLMAAATALETFNDSMLGRVFLSQWRPAHRDCVKAAAQLLRGYARWLERSWNSVRSPHLATN